MGFLRKLTTRSKHKSTWDLPYAASSHDSGVPQVTEKRSSFVLSPPPPYESQEEREISDSDLGSLLIGIDFGTT